MNLLKNLTIMIMYVFIFMQLYVVGNKVVLFMLICIGIYNIILHKTITDLNSKQKQILSTQKENFINFLSHDIRIPVIAQIRALELLKAEKFGKLNSKTKDMIEQTEQSCRCVLNLISLMINTYGIENNTYKFYYERFNISEIILSCFDELLPQAKDKNVRFEYLCENKNINILGDKIELKKVIYNTLSALITNAAECETFLISLSTDTGKIKITVSDKNNKEINIYTNSKYNPVGESIKMWFCKKIIEIHKGKIVSNKNSFTFELPRLQT